MADGGRIINPSLNVPQAMFLSLESKFRLFVGGFGSGKTFAITSGGMQHFWEYPRAPIGYFAPTYPMIRDIFYPTVDEVAHNWGFKTTLREGNKEVHIYLGSRYYGTIICRSMEKPENIVGFKIAHAMIDEMDLLKLKKALDAWRKIIARMRFKKAGVQYKNGVDLGTTPEGFKFAYKTFVADVAKTPRLGDLYRMVQASTYDNEANLPDGYIDSLVQSYPPNLIKAYLHGRFTNLAQGTVYYCFNRTKNNCKTVVEGDETLYVGMDFNVGKMCAIIHVLRDGMPHAVSEIFDVFDTPAMIKKLKDRYWKYENGSYHRTRQIRVYPDSSGDNRDTNNASTTDIQLLEEAGFIVRAPEANPPVKNRVNAMNAMFLNSAKKRRYMVNVVNCPRYTECLEQQPYNDAGDPDKSAGLDHGPDAGGYYIHHDFPIKRPVTQVAPLRV